MTTTPTRRRPLSSGGKPQPKPTRQDRKHKRDKFGTALLSETERERLEARAAHGHPIAAMLARFQLQTDDNRRRAQHRRTGTAPAAATKTGAAQKKTHTPALTAAGYTGPGGGRGVAARPVEYRGTTAQVAGLWPWAVGAGAPVLGTPLGWHLDTGEPVCFDPMNWFKRGTFITAPSLFVLGLNGFGKSTFVRRLVLGGIAQGIKPLVLADVKPDYRGVIERCGGQVIDLGYGHGKLNPLDSGVMGRSLARLEADGFATEAEILRTEIRARQTNLIGGLIELSRGERIRDFENTLISTALRILYQPVPEGGRGFTITAPPIFDDLAEVIAGGGEALRLDAAAHDDTKYQAAIVDLLRSLRALTQGNFGTVFNGQTTHQFDLDRIGVCVDVSHIANSDKKLKAAVMLASWSQGFGAIDALNLLADVGLARQQYFQVVMDELWQVLALGDFMIDRVDELTRLQRGIATSLIMISHTIKDLQSLGSEATISKALGFLERARAKVFGALPAEELRRLDSICPFTAAEQAMVTGWSAPQSLTGEPVRRRILDAEAEADAAQEDSHDKAIAPGTGKFLLKIGEDRQPGLPFYLKQTPTEESSGINATSARFDTFGVRTTADRRTS
ncbi:ATP-binding protein (plasmid) [Nocardia sp. NBC_01503]|uniref:hypothetical protein n=1 Tax=Nocardia sp. NBC_01503 TaxID=2975997 RepID=UPI002E7AF2A8|nr:hypothetical protein [Nocardia sp. NBC_01503]WTL36625.1 ATP-binding protein [Nocardia sp. NBC_01503]